MHEHEKELLAIKLALAKWRQYLHGREFDVFTDNSACRWFLSHPNVSGKLAHWLDFVSQLTFVLHHVKGSTNVVADELSRVNKSETTAEATSSASLLELISVPPSPSNVHGCSMTCVNRDTRLRSPDGDVLVLGELSVCDLNLLCSG